MLPFVRILSVLWATAVVPVATLLLCVAITWPGRAFALVAISVGVAPFLATLGRILEKPKWRRSAAGLLIFSAAIYAALAVSRPTPRSDALVQRLSPSAPGSFSRLAPVHVLPEQDQLALGYFLMVPLDPLLTFGQARQLRGLTADVYREMDAVPEFQRLPTALPDAYRSLWYPNPAGDDGFLYVPRSVDRRQPAPVLVFLHGSGGNFKGYLWILAKVADATGSILLAPNYGFGNWQSPGTERAIASALHRARWCATLDAHRMTVIGLSNGGLGVCQSLAAHPGFWSSAVLLSPVFDDTTLACLDPSRLSGNPCS